jgi:hypothetical protein
MLSSGQKLTLGLLATITLKVVPFHMYALLPTLLSFLKCILEILICEGVQYHLRFCLVHLNCVKKVAFQFCLQLEKQRQVGWVGTTVMLLSVKKFPGKKRKCDAVMQQSNYFVAKVQGEVFTHFYVGVVKRHGSM